jgi:hypothetical protein
MFWNLPRKKFLDTALGTSILNAHENIIKNTFLNITY